MTSAGASPTLKPTPVRRSVKGENTRSRILERAAPLFAEHGYADLGLQDVAAACGLSKGALFTHFESKRQIYLESVGRVYASALDTYQRSSSANTPLARLRHYLDWICPVMSENPLMCRLTLRMVVDRDIELARALLPGSFGRTHEMFLGLLKDIHPKKDPRIIAFFVYAILTLNDELLAFADVWMPSTASLVGGKKSAASLEAMITAW